MTVARPSALLGNRAMFTLTVEGCEDELRVVRFTGHEAISSPFEFRLEVAGATLSLDDLVGKPAHLIIEGRAAARHVDGILSEVEYIGESSSYTLYEFTLVPALWRLQHRTGCRIFQGQTTPQILAAVLEGAGIPRARYRLQLQASYAPRDYCVQYRETDLAFISRLMEADGIHYYFEHAEDRHVLVMTDHAEGGSSIPDDPTLTFFGTREREHISHFRLGERLRPTRVALADRNLHAPDQAARAAAGVGDAEVFEYPAGFQSSGRGGPETGGQQAKMRLEALQASRRLGRGKSDSPRLAPGFLFRVKDDARPHLEGEYRLVLVVHHGEQPQALDEAAAGEFFYGNDFECVDRRLPYRPPRVTPRPTVQGVQTATVVGPGGEEIHVDEHGRVKVLFHWDRRDVDDGSSSCWVRVSQAWAGNGFGAVFLPRVGHEVIVDFIEGDPDRPIITGRIYTGLNAPPYPLPDEKTKSTIKSESSPGGGGYNELRFEDATWRRVRSRVNEPNCARAMLLLALRGDAEGRAVLVESLQDSSVRAPALVALSYVGSPEIVDASLEWLDEPLFGSLIGEMMSALTGVDLDEAGLARLAGDDEESLEYAPEDELPRPDPMLVIQWWSRQRPLFDDAQRYLSGHPRTLTGLVDTLATGPMRRRPNLYLDLQVQGVRKLSLQPRAPTPRQRAALFEFRRLSTASEA